MFLSSIFLFASIAFTGAASSSVQAGEKVGTLPPCFEQPKTDKAVNNQTAQAQPQKGEAAKTGQKVNAEKEPPCRVKVKQDFGAQFVSVRAKKVKLTDVATEIGRQLKVPVILGPSVKQQDLTVDFEDYSIERAVKVLAPVPVIDYVISGGSDTTHPGKKEVIAIYLLGQDDKPPANGEWQRNKAGGQMIVGSIYESEEQEKKAAEDRKENLQITYSGAFFTLRIYKQFLTDVLEEVANQARIPFAIITHNGAQKEIDQVVTWNITAVSFEELVSTWFPNGVRLYWRTDVANDVSKPLRLTIEDREETQAVQNTP